MLRLVLALFILALNIKLIVHIASSVLCLIHSQVERNFSAGIKQRSSSLQSNYTFLHIPDAIKLHIHVDLRALYVDSCSVRALSQFECSASFSISADCAECSFLKN